MSIDMNKTIAEASLDKLHDIILPDPVGLFPLAPGWIIVILLVLALIFHFSVLVYRRYQKSLYRREALAQLSLYSQESKEEAFELLALAKRVAFAAYGREEIAKLTGESWWDFMEQHSKAKVSRELRDEISNLLYDQAFENNTSLYTAIKVFVTRWIKTHKVTNHV